MELKKALAELRNGKERKFDQTLDLIVNLKGIDVKKDNVSAVLNVPNKVKEKKICGFFETKSNLVKTITKPEFAKYKDKAALRSLVSEYDFFIAVAPLMPAVATTFGKVLGPAGKMPSPQLGILPNSEDKTVQAVLDKISKAVKIRAKEPSIKIAIGKSSMDDEKIVENVSSAYSGITKALPNGKENVKSVLVKFTMSKPVKVDM